MYGNKVKHYQKEALKAQLAVADPHQIIKMLMAGALDSLYIAALMIEQKDYERKSAAISKASSIIESLRLSLDIDAAPELAENLAALYFYMNRTLTEATIQNDVAKVNEVASLLGTIKSAWDAIPESAKAEAYATQENTFDRAGAAG